MSLPTSHLQGSSGSLYVVDMWSNLIQLIDVATGSVSTAVGGGNSSVQLSWPHAVAIGQGGGLFIADTSSHLVRRCVTAAGAAQCVNVAGMRYDVRSGRAGWLSPLGLAVDSSGLVCWADGSVYCISP